jgi:hypothetical protein
MAISDLLKFTIVVSPGDTEIRQGGKLICRRPNSLASDASDFVLEEFGEGFIELERERKKSVLFKQPNGNIDLVYKKGAQ